MIQNAAGADAQYSKLFGVSLSWEVCLYGTSGFTVLSYCGKGREYHTGCGAPSYYPATLSRQLMQLEGKLGVKLFHRGRHHILLTEEGMLLRRRAQEIIDLTEKTEKELMHGEEMFSGEKSIGCGETENMKPLSEMIASFQQRYPDVIFHIYIVIADEIKECLESGILDMGLLLEPVEISRYHSIRMPLKEKWQILMRKDSPLAKKEKITPEDLEGIPLIVAKRQSVRNEL